MSAASWLLGAGYPWHSAVATGVVANARAGLALEALPDGALGLGSPDGSLGRLTLPRGVAVDGAALFILAQDGSLVYRYDALNQGLEALAHVGMQGWYGAPDEAAWRAPRRFRDASAIAASAGLLYVADPHTQRVQVFDHDSLALVRIHEHMGAPIDLAAGADGVYILDGASGRVWRATPDGAAPQVVVSPAMATSADRMTLDSAGRLYLRRRVDGRQVLDVYQPRLHPAAAAPLERIDASAQVRERFAAPVLTMDDGVIAAPQWLLDPCGIRRPAPANARYWHVGGHLYVAEAGARTLSVLLADGRLRHRWGPLDADGAPTAPDGPEAWSVADVIERAGSAWILDERHQRLFTHRPGEAGLRLRHVAVADAASPHWRRLALDEDGCLLLWDGSAELAERYGPAGDARGQALLQKVSRLFQRPATAAPQWPTVRLTRTGVRPAPARAGLVWPAAHYLQHGLWTSEWLDSNLHDCHWHMLDLSIARLPSGATLRLRTRTTNDQAATRVSDAGLPGSWDELQPIIAPLQPQAGADTAVDTDLLAQSAPGRYLQLQIEMSGNGLDSAIIAHVRLRFPSESLLDYLPALYSSMPGQQAFLDRLLSIVDSSWSAIEREANSFERYLDPDSVPDHALGWLAQWLDLPLEGSWTPAQNRRLLQAMVRLRRRWGTVDGLRGWVRVYLANIAGIDEAVLAALDVPAIVETFVERRHLLLADACAVLCTAQPLWSAAVERRFQVGVFDRLGEIEVVSVGDPQTDALRQGAHAFRVYVPASLLRSAADEAKLRRAIESQKPAHASYQLILVEPRMAVGVQSTIGLDSVIAGPGAGVLPCQVWNDPPSLAPRHRLGVDTVLAAEGGLDAERQPRHTRVLA
jgi:phage tail-like protein